MAFLSVQEGSVYKGKAFGSASDAYGELVFTTSMTGYIEAVTDPSYRGQILVFAYPTIANYPVSSGRKEAKNPQVSGIITKDSHASLPFGGYSHDFSDFLSWGKVPGIDGIETRSLVRKIRSMGALRAWITSSDERRDFSTDPMLQDLARDSVEPAPFELKNPSTDKRILFINAGAKRSVIEQMSKIASLTVAPYFGPFPEEKFDAVFISNGPGDPTSPYLKDTISFVRERIGQTRIYGICLGQQIITLAYGAKTYKMLFGHRGINHAVTDGKKIKITTHNHGYAVDRESVEEKGLEIVEWDANDETPESLQDTKNSVYSVQYHPEASPGPDDTRDFFMRIKRELKP